MASEVNFDLRIGLGDSNLYVPMLLYRSGSRADKMSSKYLPLPAASLGLCQSLCETSGSLRSPLVKRRSYSKQKARKGGSHLRTSLIPHAISVGAIFGSDAFFELAVPYSHASEPVKVG